MDFRWGTGREQDVGAPVACLPCLEGLFSPPPIQCWENTLNPPLQGERWPHPESWISSPDGKLQGRGAGIGLLSCVPMERAGSLE